MSENLNINIVDQEPYEDPTTVHSYGELIAKLEHAEKQIENGEVYYIKHHEMGNFLDSVMDEVLKRKNISR